MTDETLLQGLARGDREALRAIFDAHGPRMVRMATYVVRDPQLAQEVVQGLFLRWLETLPPTAKYRRLGAFLVVAVHHAAVDWLKREDSQRGEPPGESADVDHREVRQISAAAARETRSDLEALALRALETLSEDDRSLIELRYGSGIPASESAELLGISQDAIHKRLQRARERLDAAIQAQRALPSSPADHSAAGHLGKEVQP